MIWIIVFFVVAAIGIGLKVWSLAAEDRKFWKKEWKEQKAWEDSFKKR